MDTTGINWQVILAIWAIAATMVAAMIAALLQRPDLPRETAISVVKSVIAVALIITVIASVGVLWPQITNILERIFSPPTTLAWREAVNREHTTEDLDGDVLIIGGGPVGPSGSGGSATWLRRIEKGSIIITRVSVVIYTNGEKFRGKGAHSTKARRVIELWLGPKKIYEIVCDTPGLYNDYWPEMAREGTASISTGWIDTGNLSSDGTIEFQVRAGPDTVIDLNRIELRFERWIKEVK